MNRILLFCALGALWGCRTVNEPNTEAITLSCSTSQESKVGALTAGDEVAVFGRVEGTEDYFLEAAKYGIGSDGQSLTYGSTVYYPETKQAVNFYAYFPYHTGAFSVPTDQSTAAALKQADLCWASTSSTPVSTPVSLTFQHLFARLIVQTNKPTEKIACQVVPNGSLNPATGQFTLNSSKSEVYTTGDELILPVQPLSRLVLTVSGLEYVYDGAISLLTGQSTTLNLTLNPSTKTATLNGSSTTNWTASNQQGTPEPTVSNILTLHWGPNAHTRSNEVDKIVLSIKNLTTGTTTNYTVTTGITYVEPTFTLSFSAVNLTYPYQIQKIDFYHTTDLIQSCSDLLGAMIYQPAAATIGIKDLANAIKIGNLWWATGNLVASTSTAGTSSGCQIGAPGDGGLYFQFGSLIGYKGGATANGGTGVGIPQAPLTTSGLYYWNGASSYSWANDAMVWPSELVGTKTSWTNTTGSGISTLSDYYFNYSVAPWETAEKNIRDFSVSIEGDSGSGTLATGRYAKQGVGDPCTYYLGDTWRLPTSAEIVALCNNQKPGYGTNAAWSSCGASWATSPVNGGNFASNQIFLPAAGYRSGNNGSFGSVTSCGYIWSSSVFNTTDGLNLSFNSNWAYPQSNLGRSEGFPLRCVHPV